MDTVPRFLPLLGSLDHQVFHGDGSPVRVVLESCVKTGRACSLTLRYRLQVPPKTTLCVEFPGHGVDAASGSTSAAELSFRPSLSSFDLDREGEDGGGSWRELRQEVSVTCVRAFCSPPEIALTTSDRPLTTTRVPLPAVAVTAFLTGLSISPDNFRQRWTALPCSEQAVVSADENQRQQHPRGREVFRGTRRLAAGEVKRLLFETLGMREVAGPPSGNTGVELLAAAGGLLLTPSSEAVAGRGGEKEEPSAAVCLVGVEVHSTTGAARVTTKSAERELTEGVQKEVLAGIRQINISLGAREARELGKRAPDDGIVGHQRPDGKAEDNLACLWISEEGSAP